LVPRFRAKFQLESPTGISVEIALQKAFVLVFFLATAFLLAAQICLLLMREKPWRSAREPSQIGRERKEVASKKL
jgi:hypothetical protein